MEAEPTPSQQAARRKAALRSWTFIGALLALSVVVQLGWIGQITLFGSFIRWAELQAFLKQSNEGFVLGAVVAIYLELVKPSSFSDYFRADVKTLDAFLASTSTGAGVDFFLSRQYPSKEGLHVLRDTVVSEKTTLLDCRLSLTLTSDPEAPPDAPAHLRQYKISFTAEIETFIFATARTPEIADVLFNCGPDITEICLCSPSNGVTFEQASKKLIDTHPVKLNGQALPLAPFQGAISDKLAKQNIKAGVDYQVFFAEVPSDAAGRSKRFTIQTERPAVLPTSGYMHWMADRPLYLQDVTVDVAHFPDRAKLNFEIIPFLGTLDRMADFRNGQFTLHVDRWLVRGQGICLVWGPGR